MYTSYRLFKLMSRGTLKLTSIDKFTCTRCSSRRVSSTHGWHYFGDVPSCLGWGVHHDVIRHKFSRIHTPGGCRHPSNLQNHSNKCILVPTRGLCRLPTQRHGLLYNWKACRRKSKGLLGNISIYFYVGHCQVATWVWVDWLSRSKSWRNIMGRYKQNMHQSRYIQRWRA